MPASNLIKIVAAFAAGILVALGSALVYMRVNDGPKYQPPTIVVPASTATSDTPASGAPAPDVQPPPPTPAPATSRPAAHPATLVHRTQPKSRPEVREKAVAVAQQQAKPAPEPVQIAQNSPVAPPPYPPPQQASGQSSAGQDAPPAGAQEAPQETPPPAHQPHVVTLPAGTTVVVRLGETVSTDHNYTGDAFRGTLDAPVIMDGFIIADRGSKVLGKVVNADKGGHLSGMADLSLALTEIHTTDGQTVQIDTSAFDKKGPKNTASNAEKIGGGAALGAIIGAIAAGGKGAAIGAGAGGAAGTGVALATHGKGATVPSETKVTFQLSNPVTITEKLH
jgi:hypothetical protein